jgi:hypothetical protein
LYGVLRDHCSHYPDCEYKLSACFPEPKTTLRGE